MCCSVSQRRIIGKDWESNFPRVIRQQMVGEHVLLDLEQYILLTFTFAYHFHFHLRQHMLGEHILCLQQDILFTFTFIIVITFTFIKAITAGITAGNLRACSCPSTRILLSLSLSWSGYCRHFHFPFHKRDILWLVLLSSQEYCFHFHCGSNAHFHHTANVGRTRYSGHFHGKNIVETFTSVNNIQNFTSSDKKIIQVQSFTLKTG